MLVHYSLSCNYGLDLTEDPIDVNGVHIESIAAGAAASYPGAGSRVVVQGCDAIARDARDYSDGDEHPACHGAGDGSIGQSPYRSHTASSCRRTAGQCRLQKAKARLCFGKGFIKAPANTIPSKREYVDPRIEAQRHSFEARSHRHRECAPYPLLSTDPLGRRRRLRIRLRFCSSGDLENRIPNFIAEAVEVPSEDSFLETNSSGDL